MPDNAPVPAEPPAELTRLYASVTALAETLRRLLAAETEAAEPARRKLKVAR
jgi:hypothetical protein